MIFPFDEEYIATKQIVLGKAQMNPDFAELAGFINEKFGIRPINIIYDTIDNGERPRLAICLELEKEEGLFKDERKNYDHAKQDIVAEKFAGMVNSGRLGDRYNADNVFVYFCNFESVAQMEFNESILPREIAALKEKLNNKDIWEIMPKFTGVTFFVYTDSQLKHYLNSKEPLSWVDAYFDLLKKYDEFNYFKREQFTIALDSKERFDDVYNGDWFDYFR